MAAPGPRDVSVFTDEGFVTITDGFTIDTPALVVTGLFSFMTAWNQFILAATFMNDERAFTLPVVLQSYVGDFGTEWGRFAAGAVLVSLPVMALFFVLQKHLVAGLTSGGVKG